MTAYSRRDALRLLLTTPALALLAAQGGCARAGAAQGARAVRRSAAALDAEEAALFRRAYELVVRDGTLDLLVAEHDDHAKHRMHEASPGVAVPVPSFMPPPGGARFLAWHRAFLLEMEAALRAAVRRAHGEEAAGRVSIPYWDSAHDRLPAWVRAFRPRGVRAPGTLPLARVRPRPEHVRALLRRGDYTRFTRGVEWAPAVARTPTPAQMERLEGMVARLDGTGAELLPLLGSLRAGEVREGEEAAVLRALFRLAAEPGAAELARAAARLFVVAPHFAIHLQVGGSGPAHDPVFWLLHAEVDRLWTTWQTRHAGAPELRGEDALFHPREGGRRWTLDELLDHDSLPYRYDRLHPA